jgi:hypothetical protein
MLAVQVPCNDIHLLEVRPTVSYRLQSKPKELRGDIVGGDMVFQAGRTPPRQIVGSQEV